MLDTKNRIGDIENSTIGDIKQINIEKQENNLTINNFQMSCANDKFLQMATSHKLFPYFIVDLDKMSDGRYKLISKPTRAESTIKYPSNFKSTFTVIDERYKDIKNREELLDILQFSDSPVEIRINKFTQYLGKEIDPYPDPELSPMQEGVKSYIMPHKRKLPDIKWNIDIGFENSKFKLNNIQLKLVKQLSSNTFLFNNYHQHSKPVLLELRLQINKDYVNCNLNYKINEDSINDSKTVFVYNKFALNLLKNPYYMYEKNKKINMMSGKSDKTVSEQHLESLSHYIDIIEKIIAIEKYFNIKFNIPNEILKEDVATINKLYGYIISSKRKVKAIDVYFSMLKKDIEYERLKKLIELPRTSLMTTSEKVNFNILGVDIKIEKIIEKYNDIKCLNKEEVNEFLNNYDLLDDDFVLKVIMVPTKGKYLYKTTEIEK